MFDFLKRKSYKIENVNGIKKLVIAKDVNSELENFKKTFEKQLEIINGIELLKNSDIQKDLSEKVNEIKTYLENVEKMEESFNALEDLSKYKSLAKDLDKNISNIQKIIDKLGKSSTTQGEKEKLVEKVEEVAGVDTDAAESNPQEEAPKTEEPNKEETPEKPATEEADKEEDAEFDIDSLFSNDSAEGDKEEGMEKKTSLSSKDLKRTADKAPGSSKYRAEGIKERLLEINKEVVNVKTPGVTYIGGVDKSVITPGPKSTSVKVKEEVVRPDIVVQNVKIRIMRDEGEKSKLLPEKNIKMPKGDVVVKKAATDNQKFQQLSEDNKKKVEQEKQEALKAGANAQKIDEIDKKYNIYTESEDESSVTASLYDQAMTKIFADFNNDEDLTSDFDFTEPEETEVEVEAVDSEDNID